MPPAPTPTTTQTETGLGGVEKLIEAWAARRRLHHTDNGRLAYRALDRPEGARGRCLLEAAALADHLGRGRLIRITGRTYTGREHWALLLDPAEHPDAEQPHDEDQADEPSRYVVDLTARQFRSTAPYPMVRQEADWLDDMAEWLADALDVEVIKADGSEGLGSGEVVETDVWVRDDVEPGPMPYE